MLSQEKHEEIRKRTEEYYKIAHIIMTPKESRKIEIADFGLNDIEAMGLQLVIYVNTDRVCAKEMVLFPSQICPEHKHPTLGGVRGKEETFRCRYGKVYLYVTGEKSKDASADSIPEKYREYFSAFHKIELNPGEQYTIKPDTLHWFQAGKDGAVVSEFSTTSHDETDIFTDPHIVR